MFLSLQWLYNNIATLMQTRCHLSVLVHEQAKKYGDRPVLNYRDFGSLTWKQASWNDFSQKVLTVSNAMLNLGIRVQENVGVFSQNTVQYLYTDFGAFGIRAVTVPFYATSSEQQIQYIIGDAQIRFLFVGEQEQYDKAFRVLPLCPTLEKIIVFDHSVRMDKGDPSSIYFDDFLKLGEGLPRQSEVETLWAEANDDDLANILYTSGTTGDSKGVMLTYGQYAAAMIANDKCVAISTQSALKKMLLPGLLAVVIPIAIGCFDPAMLGGFLAGAVSTGMLLAIFMSNSGGAWDNAKKYIEGGHHGGKGSEAHKAAVVGDTVGDPFKDTSGPSMNILINLMTIISLTFSPLFIMIQSML